MNWKAEAEERLRSYPALQSALVQIPRQLQSLQQELTRLRSVSMQSGSSQRNIRAHEERILGCLTAQEILKRSLEQAKLWVRIIEDALARLAPEDRRILQWMYTREREEPLGQLCRELGMEKSSIYRHREKALRKFTLSVYGALESN